MSTRWSGNRVRQARAYWRPRLPVPCCRCGRTVYHDDRKPAGGWHVDHYPIPRSAGGTETRPAHDLCNTSDGGKVGAAITNSRRRPRRPNGNIRGV